MPPLEEELVVVRMLESVEHIHEIPYRCVRLTAQVRHKDMDYELTVDTHMLAFGPTAPPSNSA